MQIRSRSHRPRWRATALIILASGCIRPAVGQPPPARPGAPVAGGATLPARELTLEQAVAHAFARAPEIHAAEARLAEARGRLTHAETYPHNPVVEGESASRRGGGRRDVDFTVGVGQEIEIAGQRRARIEVASAELAAESANLWRARRLLAARVHLAFIAALEARALLAVSRRDRDLAARLEDLARRRLDRGAGTQLDVNVAAADLGRAEARAQAAEADYLAERAILAEAIGLEPIRLPVPEGDLRAELEAIPPLARIVEIARTHRADLQGLRDLETASRARRALARAEAWPNLTVRAFGGHEEGTDTVVGAGVSIPLPLFDRNQGPIQVAAAHLARVRAEREMGEITVGREVVAAHARYQAALKTAARLRQLVLGTLEQSFQLLQRSFEAGKATWPEVVVIRRTLVDAERELTAADASARRAWVELQVASGRIPLPDSAADPEEEK